MLSSAQIQSQEDKFVHPKSCSSSVSTRETCPCQVGDQSSGLQDKRNSVSKPASHEVIQVLSIKEMGGHSRAS